MTPSNIATVLAPNVLYSRVFYLCCYSLAYFVSKDTGKKLDATNIQEGLLSGKAEQMALANKVVELIVTHAPDIFTDEVLSYELNQPVFPAFTLFFNHHVNYFKMLQKAQEEVTEIVQKAREGIDCNLGASSVL